MLAIIAAAIYDKFLLLIFLIIMYGLFYRFTALGTDFYIAMLLGFLMSGIGIVYLGEKSKGFAWFSLQILAFIAAIIIHYTTDIESKYIGFVIFTLWIIQLMQTAVIYKDKFGDIDLF